MNSEETGLSFSSACAYVSPPFTVSHWNQCPYNVISCLQILMVRGSTDPTLSLSMQLRKQCSVFRTLRAETEVPSSSTLTSLSTTKEPWFCGWSVGWCENEPTQVTFANLMAPRLGQLGPKGRMWQFWEHKIFVLNLFPSSIYSASSLQLRSETQPSTGRGRPVKSCSHDSISKFWIYYSRV